MSSSEMEKGGAPDKPYSGMGKEDLLRFSDTPFWNNLRLALFITFWVCWAALLATVLGMTITAPRCEPAPAVSWWQSAPFYQIYVRSFYDSDGDGIGDIQGLIQKLDHLANLNVAGIIVSSFYSSHAPDASNPDPDFGYEIINHKDVDAAYGNMSDVEQLIAEAHSKGIKLILDFIPNHTGTQHEWFLGSDSSASDPYANYYVWADCAPNQPNNWKAIYNDPNAAPPSNGIDAWSASTARTGECYLHQGLSSQPDLNLFSAQVRTELEDILRFWLDKGVDGFRVISAKYLFEDILLRDEPLANNSGCTTSDTSYECYDHIYTTSQEENFALIASWRALIEDYNEADPSQQRVLLTDAKEDVETAILYYGDHEKDGTNLALNYDLLTQAQAGCNGKCMEQLVQNWLNDREDFITTDWMTGHQDEERLNSTLYGDALLVLKLTLPGSSILYYGEEIGMTNGDVSGDCLDPAGAAGAFCRDRSRTPMQWTDEPGAGFSSNDSSWLPVNADYTTRNVETFENADEEFNTLKVYRKMAELQNSSTAFNYGILETVVVTDEIYSFVRYFDGTDRYLVTMNLGNQASRDNYADYHSLVPGSATVVVSNTGWSADTEVNLKDVELEAGEYAVFMWPYSR